MGNTRKPIKKTTAPAARKAAPAEPVTSSPSDVVDDVVDEDDGVEDEGDASPNPDNSLDNGDLTKDGDNSEEVTEGGDVDYSDTNPNPPRSSTGTPLVEGSQEPDAPVEVDLDTDIDSLAPDAREQYLASLTPEQRDIKVNGGNYSAAEDHEFKAPEAGPAAHGDGVLGDQTSVGSGVETGDATPPGITSTSARGNEVLLATGEEVVRQAPDKSKGSVPPDALILGPNEAARFEGDRVEGDDNHVMVRRNVYREVYYGRSKTPSYVKEFSKGTLVSTRGIAAQ